MLQTDRLLGWLALIGLLLIITVSTIMADMGWYNPLERLANKFPAGDKLGHFLLAGGLAFSLNLVLKGRKLTVIGLRLYCSGLVIGLLAVTEELSQMFFPARSFSWSDLSAGLLGVVLMNHLADLVMKRQITVMKKRRS